MEGSAAEYKSSEDEGKMINIAQHSLQKSMETKICQINPETWQKRAQEQQQNSLLDIVN